MYTPSSFSVNDPSLGIELINRYNFGMFISNGADSPLATHLPFMIETEETKPVKLITHMAKANKHWRKLNDGDEVLCIFNGPHAYISPSWYEDRVTVPTWNYATVHVRGKIKLIHDELLLRKIVTDLTHFMETTVDSDWSLVEGESTIPIELKAIVGIEIQIEELITKFKFNQNRSVEDQKKVIESLEKLEGNYYKEIVEIMNRNLKAN